MLRATEDVVNLQDKNRRPLEWSIICSLLGERCEVRILDTIFIEGGELIEWYFTSKEGEVMKKHDRNVTPENIIKQFNRYSKSSERNVDGWTSVLWHEEDESEVCEVSTSHDVTRPSNPEL